VAGPTARPTIKNPSLEDNFHGYYSLGPIP
jgi:hypothetical protein